MKHGVELIYVSNHGGHQLDPARAAFVTLPEVVRAVDSASRCFDFHVRGN